MEPADKPLSLGIWDEQVTGLDGFPEITVRLTISLLRALILHAAVCLGIRLSDVPPTSRQVLDIVANDLEYLLEAEGFPSRPGGWRSENGGRWWPEKYV